MKITLVIGFLSYYFKISSSSRISICLGLVNKMSTSVTLTLHFTERVSVDHDITVPTPTIGLGLRRVCGQE